MSSLQAANLQFDIEVFLQTNFTPAERYQAINDHVRTWYRTVMSWPYIARYCDLVETEKLYEVGGFKTMTDWLDNAAPKCARTLASYREVRGKLSADFSDIEMSEMPKETAKFIAKNVTSHEHRKNPKIKAASKKERAECVKAIREELPELHLEDVVNASFTESQMKRMRPILERYRAEEQDLDMLLVDAIEGVVTAYGALRERLDSLDANQAVPDVNWVR